MKGLRRRKVFSLLSFRKNRKGKRGGWPKKEPGPHWDLLMWDSLQMLFLVSRDWLRGQQSGMGDVWDGWTKRAGWERGT